jgi:hypothetical protein
VSPGVRVIRFTRVADSRRAGPAGPVFVAGVVLHEQPVPVGHIVVQDRSWHYVLADGIPCGLTSTISRQDLEEQIVQHHFGPPEAAEPAHSESALALAV